MPRVFVSYRREDTGTFAAQLAARLRLDLRLENVFLDRAKIEAGVDWRKMLDDELLAADAVLVLVGAAWAGPDGRRIHATDDMVAWELRRARKLRRDLVPVMVDGATWPERLPEDLAGLGSLHFVNLSSTSMDTDATPLGYLELLGDLFYKAVRRYGDVVVVHDESDTAEVHVRELAARLTSGVPVQDAEHLVRAVSRGFAAIPLDAAAARWPEVVVLVTANGRTPALEARIRGLERNNVRVALVAATTAGITGFLAGQGIDRRDGELPTDEGTSHTVSGATTKPHRPPLPAQLRWLKIGGAALATAVAIGLGGGTATGVLRWPWTPSSSPSPSTPPLVSVSPQAPSTSPTTGSTSESPTPGTTSKSPTPETSDAVTVKISLHDTAVTFTPAFTYRMTGTARPAAELVYRSLSEDCIVNGDSLTLAQAWPLLPITCPVEVRALPSATVVPGPPVTAAVTVAAPDLDLVAAPAEEIPFGADRVTVIVKEYTGTAAGLTASVTAGACAVDVTSADQPGTTVFEATITRTADAGEGYACTITWTARSAVGAPEALATTFVAVKGQVG